jgi:hypothetical protein
MQTGIAAPAVTVRAALPTDVTAMAALHVRAWRATYTGMLPDAFLAGLKIEDREAMWRRSVTEPNLAPAERVILVAETRDGAGFRRGGPRPRRRRVRPRGAVRAQRRSAGVGAGRRPGAAGGGERLARRAFCGFDPVGGRPQPARAHLYERAGWSLDSATKLEVYDGTSVNNCRYRRRAIR